MAKIIENSINENKFSNEEEMNSYKTKGIIGMAITLISWLILLLSIINNGANSSEIFPIFFIGVLVGGSFGGYHWSKYKQLKSGNTGEKSTFNAFKGLSDEYYIMHNVPLVKGDKRTEIDILVISPYGVQIIEVKNHKGKITGNKADSSWTQHKVGRNGGKYIATMKNPLKQLNFQKFLLSDILKDNGLKVWVDGYVLMPNVKEIQFECSELFDRDFALINKITRQKDVKINEDCIKKMIVLLNH